ncbi:fasciclin domain-containing protein [Aeoliella sp. ICT_H6.2]|uniref:Fasciclin domain-containing protein n=1 Tax=Aeoliella straminimaris TaxID=2954799 RepID=A0A9X2FGA2_9BACT|nr:fasciclin domain-containing protein [Aeoliella straminimaris]MCO6047783.1 fasciclin domain-containing protein [Aeoliella straminimaris]
MLRIKRQNFALAALTGLLMVPTAVLSAADIVETAVSAGQFDTLVKAVKAADLVETLQGEGPFTVFAPTDEAFAAIPKEKLAALLKPQAKKQLAGVLLYHVVPGEVTSDKVTKLSGATTANGQRVDIAVKDGKVSVDGATVVKTDIKCDNGVIHVIDAVILPESRSIPEVAADAKAFSTLIAAAKAAGLVETLSGDKPLTVFAPTDDAFAALPEGTVESLLKPENKDKLKAVLTYHVVPGRVYSTDALKAGEATTVQGGKVNIAVDGDAAMVNDAKLLKTDIDASNGVIHVIDKVLLPKSNSQQSSTQGASDVQHVSTTAQPCPVAAARAKALANAGR